MTRLESVPIEDDKDLEDLTTREIAQLMVRIQRMRRAKVTELKQLTIKLAEAKKNATEVHARAFLSHDGPQEERTQTAKLAAAGAVFAAEAKKAEVDACKASMDVLKDDWDTCRSIGANERAERNAIEGYGS